MKNNAFFVTGTDTDVGKTFVSLALLEALKQKGLSTLALKPVAAGCEQMEGQWCNDDALQLQQAMTEQLPYQQVNPVALKQAVAPHLAAQAEGKRLTVDHICGRVKGAMMQPADVCLIEGAGGWLVPLNDRESFADMVVELQLPVLLVVAVKLGCLNHALLTAEAIQARGLPFLGWVANCMDPSAALVKENIATLEQRLPGPCLGVLKRADNGDWRPLGANFNTDLLLEKLGLE